MSKQCIHKETDGQQCPLMVETGLFCKTHSVEASKVKPRREGPGPGWGSGGGSGSSLLRYMGVVYHHGPPHKKDDLD